MGAVWTPAAAVRTAAQPVDYFQFPLPSWAPHCLGFGSEWRYCDGTVLRRCSATGAIWLHTGADITTGIQPVMAAANGVIFGDIADMGPRTHFHFAVFIGDYEADAWRGALPPTRCDGFPAFPYRFVNPTDFVMSHWQP